MKKYLLSSERGLKVELSYNDSGVLYALEFHCEVDYERVRRLLQLNDILTEDSMFQVATRYRFKVSRIEEDLSFDRFWNEYGYKVGSKQKAMKLWNNLSNADKIACLRQIRAYKHYLERTGIAQAYPETYLRNRRWEDQYQ